MKTLIEHAMIVTMNDSREVIKQGYLLVEQDRINEIGAGVYQGDKDGIEIVNGKNNIIIPGLINAHTHSYANLVKGTTENIPLELWMLYIMAEGKNMTKEDYAINAALGSIEMLKSGTTTFLDHLAQDADGMKTVAAEYKKAGIRAVLTPMFGDRAYADSLPEALQIELGKEPHGPKAVGSGWQDNIAMVESVIQNVSEPDKGITVAVGPSGPQRCSDELLVASMELAQKYELPWHTHLLETKAQEVTGYERYGHSMVEHLEKLGILNESVSFAHGVWVSDTDIELIAKRGSTIVHNPTSNLLLGSGVLPLIPLKEAGVHIGIGTDGANCCGYQSMFESMKLAAILSNTFTPDYQRWVKAVDVLEMATIGSARAVGMSDEIGSLEAGKKADFVLLNKEVSNFAPLNDLIWQLVYGRADMAIDAVYVNGKKVVSERKAVGVDEKAIFNKAIENGADLLQRNQTEFEKIKNKAPDIYHMLMKVAEIPTKQA
ncbi:amidohydrolase [Alkalihalobacillus oceani]|uniref:amidohydrolase family protein n=1 Tax=Halalkalibacter oceani TaxID=1653776 RepID=UPI00204105B1|nr:amidohydrolase [Halalkalibacter oceani]MCM3761142.1 amidohydrolase [Halalkalibacter oceani]